MDTHGYPSLRINTHFTLTKVIVYNPKINVLDIGYTSFLTVEEKPHRKTSVLKKTIYLKPLTHPPQVIRFHFAGYTPYEQQRGE